MLAQRRGQPEGEALKTAIVEVLDLPPLPNAAPDSRILRPVRPAQVAFEDLDVGSRVLPTQRRRQGQAAEPGTRDEDSHALSVPRKEAWSEWPDALTSLPNCIHFSPSEAVSHTAALVMDTTVVGLETPKAEPSSQRRAPREVISP